MTQPVSEATSSVLARRDRIAHRVSLALAAWSALTAALSFVFWRVFHRDVPMTIGNMRGTALTVLAIAVPLLIGSMTWASRGSLRARFVWLASVAYLAYNAVMFCFAAQFNGFFLLFTTMLALTFWALITLVRTFDLDRLREASSLAAARAVAIYMFVSLVFFGYAWLVVVVPASLQNVMPLALAEAGMQQNPVWVLDFGFTFPLMALGGFWLWTRRPWGYVVGGMMTIMLTIETAGIAVDQIFGHLHDPAASLAAAPIMLAFTALGLVFSLVFLRSLRGPRAAGMPVAFQPARG